MVLLLNYLHWFILIAGAYLALNSTRSYIKMDKAGVSPEVVADVRKATTFRVVKIVVAAIVLAYVSVVVQTSYTPRGSVPRIAGPVYEVKEDGPVIQDRLRNTVKPEEEAQRDFDKMVDWRNSKTEESSSDTTGDTSKKE